jgi:hypothetical protein
VREHGQGYVVKCGSTSRKGNGTLGTVLYSVLDSEKSTTIGVGNQALRNNAETFLVQREVIGSGDSAPAVALAGLAVDLQPHNSVST